MKIKLSELKALIKKELLEVDDPHGIRGGVRGAFGGLLDKPEMMKAQFNIAKSKWPNEVAELLQLGWWNVYVKVNQAWNKDPAPGGVFFGGEKLTGDHTIIPPIFLDNIPTLVQKYPKAFEGVRQPMRYLDTYTYNPDLGAAAQRDQQRHGGVGGPAGRPQAPEKQNVLATVEKMHEDLRGLDPKFKIDSDLRKQYEKALGAVTALRNDMLKHKK